MLAKESIGNTKFISTTTNTDTVLVAEGFCVFPSYDNCIS
jgi:hypothetical protein